MLLKGSRTLIADPQGNVYVNMSGNSALAKGGSGDVLAGVIGSLLAQGYDAVTAARLGAYIHGSETGGDTHGKRKFGSKRAPVRPAPRYRKSLFDGFGETKSARDLLCLHCFLQCF